jgi:hypothetical protein
VTRPNKRRARFGPAWWDRGGHFGFWTEGGPLTVWGIDDVPWPRPCKDCLEMWKEEDDRRSKAAG